LQSTAPLGDQYPKGVSLLYPVVLQSISVPEFAVGRNDIESPTFTATVSEVILVVLFFTVAVRLIETDMPSTAPFFAQPSFVIGSDTGHVPRQYSPIIYASRYPTFFVHVTDFASAFPGANMATMAIREIVNINQTPVGVERIFLMGCRVMWFVMDIMVIGVIDY
jgi:predicted neutral ceramidase superfamily lipid hydrolase